MRKTLLMLLAWSALVGSLSGQRNFFTGRVIAGGLPRSDVFIHLEGFQQERLDTVFTDATGSFRFEGFVADAADYVYIVVEEEGFKPYRERLDVSLIRGGVVTVYLEPETSNATGSPGGGSLDGDNTVDIRQLQVRVPDEAWDAYDQAVAAAENPEEVIGHLERALRLAPDFYAARINLGGVYTSLGRYRDAEATYLLAMESNPTGALAPLNLGALYYQEAELIRGEQNETEAAAKFELARDTLDRAIRLNPYSAEARYYLGAVLYRTGAYEEAEQLLLLALELDPAVGSQARLALINVYTRQGRFDSALEQIAAFIEEDPDSPQRPSVEQIRSQIEAVIQR